MPDQKMKNHCERTPNTNIKKIRSKETMGKDHTLCDFVGHFDSKMNTSSMKTKPNTHLLSEMLFFLRKQYQGICPRALEESSIASKMPPIIVHIHYPSTMTANCERESEIFIQNRRVNGSILAIKIEIMNKHKRFSSK